MTAAAQFAIAAGGASWDASRIPQRPAGAISAARRPVTAATAAGNKQGHPGARDEIPRIKAGWDADRAVTALYGMHYNSLVKLAAMLVGDVPTAEEIVQDSFVAMHAAWRSLADGDRALPYLRQAVVRRCRLALRRRAVADKPAPAIAPGAPGGAPEEITLFERSALVRALRTLPSRQREALLLRYFADLSEAEAASAMGIRRGAVNNRTARAISALLTELQTCESHDGR